MEANRRRFLIGTSLVAASASVAGYKDMLGTAATMGRKGRPAKDAIYADAQETEGVIATSFDKNSAFSLRNGVCNGCTSHCGMRVKIDNATGKVIKASGNPYNPLSTDPWLPYNTPLKESFTLLGKESGHLYRSTACARGNVVFDRHYDKGRVLTPLKRVGKRGENRWQSITPEQLLQEIVHGGDLFGEGEVKGLAAIRDLETPMDPNGPKCGPKANGLCVLGTGNEGRQAYMVNRFIGAFGTRNYMGHTAICGLSMRSGEAAYLGDFQGYPHLKPDFEHCEYLLSIGTAPAQAGNPFKRQAKLLAKARTYGNLKCVTVAPMLTNADALAAGDRSEWIPIQPGGDLAFVMGLLRVIIAEKLYNEPYLKLPSQMAQKAFNDASWTNASHLVIQSGDKAGQVLQKGEEPLVLDEETHTLKPSSEVHQGCLFVDESLEYEGELMALKSAMTLLKEAAFAHTLEEYAQESGVAVARIVRTAREFASHGRKAAVDCHGGTMHTTGFYTTYAIMMLGAMVGNLNYQGGMSAGGGKYKDFNGAKYNLLGFPGKVASQGYRVDRARFAYEKTTEYAQKVARGENPYPARDTWYPLTNALESEVIFNSAKKYPYALDALISWNANIVYGQSGANALEKLLKDPKKAIPLFIAIDPFINETSRFADYIVPDSVMYETWGVVSPWAGYQTKANTVRFPTIAAPQASFANGEPVSMDSFVIELGKALGLPGFGTGAIAGKNGEKYDFNRPSDFYLRAFENIALDGDGVAECTDEEIELAGLEPYVKLLQSTCGENWRKTAYVMARGGRFEEKEKGYAQGKLAHPYKKPIQIYNQALGTARHSLTGEAFSGVPTFMAARLSRGEKLFERYPKADYPLSAFSYKSNVLSQATASSEMIKDIRPTTYIDLNPQTAQEYKVAHGQSIKLVSPGGSIQGRIRFRHGVLPGAVAIEHGAGREGEGALDVWINDQKIEGCALRKSGVSINKLGLMDSSRELATLSDFVIGSNARQALPVRIEAV
ncbi:MAG: tetrathionate reductase subunit TtrA [Campylobacterales bacterium]|nr:tetrathionate reductase subunit TtrA [Campylobacterales bacterium]